MNKVVLIGRLTADPGLRFIPGSGAATCTLTLAIDKFVKGEKQVDFVPVVIYGKQAESTANYMTKGSQVAISGRIQTRSYDAKDGTKRYVTEVVADQFGGVEFLGSKGKGASGSNEYSQPANDAFGGGFDEELIVDDSDSNMPF
ncbi:single-stranded DNA-binding protein [Clostridium beijerinckii]|uniref:single-stranded DNA-binding protein n=1 Tax=Clostridium beijerinckii TaxID=1520 RepID=UPI00047B76D9|nr:single-stranded DNA-binding protein [Clostridium beijerinckii]